jgi:hypothetical protein
MSVSTIRRRPHFGHRATTPDHDMLKQSGDREDEGGAGWVESAESICGGILRTKREPISPEPKPEKISPSLISLLMTTHAETNTIEAGTVYFERWSRAPIILYSAEN